MPFNYKNNQPKQKMIIEDNFVHKSFGQIQLLTNHQKEVNINTISEIPKQKQKVVENTK